MSDEISDGKDVLCGVSSQMLATLCVIARFLTKCMVACTVNVCDRFCVFLAVSLQIVMCPDSAEPRGCS